MSGNVIFEVGLEELPARFIDDAETQLVQKSKKWLENLRISYDSIIPFSTPRRLAILIKGIASEQTTIKEEARGPSVKIARDGEGNWSKAAIGFTKGQGKTIDDIYLKEVKGTEYVFVEKHIEGKSTLELLPGFKEIIMSIQFSQTMHWGDETVRYARPIRWLVALYDNNIIPFEIAHVKTSNVTKGHRFLGDEITLHDPLEYEGKLMDNFVIANKNEREKRILSGIKEIEDKSGFQVMIDQNLLNEVRNLVEYPTVFSGTYEEEYLQLPSEVLITSMKEHQRYFPVTDNNGKLIPYFIGVRNGNDYGLKTVVKGNEKVLHARLSDGQFFYEEDQKYSIESYQNKLSRVVFQERLGSLTDKVSRVTLIAKELGQLLQVDSNIMKKVIRAAEISKFDLMTSMVNEFTELQGVIGEKYARNFGEDEQVAIAIREHYLPKQANGALPVSLVGAIISIADKLDTIVGFISVGLIPSGSQDPYGLRRQAIGILRILTNRNWNITLEEIIQLARNNFLNLPDLDIENIDSKFHEFFRLRATYLLRELKIEQDVINAVLYNEIGIFSYTTEKALIVAKKRNDINFKDVQEALVRVLNLAKSKKGMEVKPSLFETKSEQLLFETYEQILIEYTAAKNEHDAHKALDKLSELAGPIHSFFDNNMVMAEDEEIRANRLALVNKIAILVKDYADLSIVQWKQQA